MLSLAVVAWMELMEHVPAKDQVMGVHRKVILGRHEWVREHRCSRDLRRGPLTFWATPVTGCGLAGRGHAVALQHLLHVSLPPSSQNLRCSCARGGAGWSAGAVLGAGAHAHPLSLTFSCNMCFLCCRIARLAGAAGDPASSLLPAARVRREARAALELRPEDGVRLAPGPRGAPGLPTPTVDPAGIAAGADAGSGHAPPE